MNIDEQQTVDNLMTDNNPIKKKRKRKRYRKRKPKIKQIEYIAPLVLNISAKPKLHIKFDENDELIYKIKDDSIDISNVSTYSKINKILSELNTIEIFSLKDGKTIKENDCLIFKILKMGENYTPEMSSVIVGKVITFDEIALNLEMILIKGQDQINEPMGKFSINNCDDDDGNDNNETCTNPEPFVTNFLDLIEPRVISEFFQDANNLLIKNNYDDLN